MIGLTARELTEMREAIGELLPDVCDILTITESANGYGGTTQIPETTVKNCPCRMDVVGGKLQVAGGALQSFIGYTMSLPYDIEVTEANQILFDGVTYKIAAPPNTQQSWIGVKRVLLERA